VVDVPSEEQGAQEVIVSEAIQSDTVEEQEEPPELVDALDSDEEDEEDDEEEPPPEDNIASRTRRQTGAPMNPPPRYTMASVKKEKESCERLKAIERADKDEIELLFVELRGLAPEFEENIKGPVYKC